MGEVSRDAPQVRLQDSGEAVVKSRITTVFSSRMIGYFHIQDDVPSR